MSEIIVIIRPSFMKFCEDGCRAALFNHILYWIAKKAKDQPQNKIQSGDITYYATTDELVEQMAGAWGYQKVRKEVNDLVDMGIIGRAKNPKFGADRTKHFYFGNEQCKKLLELCQKHGVDLSKIGLPSEMTNLIKQFTNPSNANDKSVKCSEHKQFTNPSNANDKSVRAITKNSTKNSYPEETERKNDESQQKSNSEEKQESHSFVQSFPSLQDKISPKETEPEEIVFPLEAEQVYENAAKLHLTYLKRDEKHRDNCIILADNGVTTLEKLESLMQYCRQIPFLAGRSLNLKNLVNELNGWLQVQPSATPARQRSADDPIEKYRAAQRRAEQSRIREEARAGVARSSYDDDDYVDDTFYPVRHIVAREGAG